MKKAVIFAAVATVLCNASLKAQEISENIAKYQLGDFTVYSLSDSHGTVKESLIGNADKTILERAKRPGWDDNSVNYFLLDAGAEKILFDAGLPAQSGGKIMANLKQVGVKAQDITMVVLTHMHGDHIGGMLDAKGNKAFPNANIFVGAEEAAYWSDETQTGQGFLNARNVMKVYEGAVVKFAKKTQILPSVQSVPLFGHTPGHTGYWVESNGQKLLIWGDVIHAAVQFDNPEIFLTYDVDPKTATKTRKSILKKAASSKNTKLAGMHLEGHGLGVVEKEGKSGYKFTLEQ
ncbi:glyoxylase-like metal-dependent hydrolase (beta-lactamase superfamily II) [Elusimicrobium posterum]|uniref:MBL fold metallo-hydrolase n=1 Tax=Elusimicrobium posterum TaxID=3116653 RepID=UPI003C72C10D